jgi:hypothetical protein
MPKFDVAQEKFNARAQDFDALGIDYKYIFLTAWLDFFNTKARESCEVMAPTAGNRRPWGRGQRDVAVWWWNNAAEEQADREYPLSNNG